jgi:hypothetical protein
MSAAKYNKNAFIMSRTSKTKYFSVLKNINGPRTFQPV